MDRCKSTLVLDLFCGRGGWSKPFIQDGDEVWGIDIKDYGYPGKLIQGDIRELDGYGFSDFDFIIGSPPCAEFSIAKNRAIYRYPGKVKRDVAKGLELVHSFKRFVNEARPEWWAMENVEQLTRYYDVIPNWRFKISKGGKRCLWTNVPIPLSQDHQWKRKLREMSGWGDGPAKRAEIPYPIARFVADSVKGVSCK